MSERRIKRIVKGIEYYTETIAKAEEALVEAERELVEEIDRYTGDGNIEDYPEYDKD